VLTQNSNAGSNPLRVNVTAQQFAWQFEYANGPAEGTTVTTLRLPLDRTVELSMRSKDVIHSFWVPEFGQKMDVLPWVDEFPHPTKLPITPTKVGTFPIICTELCGLGHSLMRSRVVVMRAGEFDRWARSQQ
jgi:cytochrome c oxidase subunit 2